MSKRTVIVLKSESETSDVYSELLEEKGFNAVFVPTLAFGFKRLNDLRTKLLQPEKYAGIIFTSPRCVEAVRQSLQSNELPDVWKMLYNYSVGEVTHNLAQSSLHLFTQGKQTGNAKNLADFIVETFNGNKTLPFLLPCGNLRTDTMLSKLTEQDLIVDACEVYETICHPEFNTNFERALNNEKNIEYLAFFSPSGVSCVCDYLKENNIGIGGKKLIAIGPSTRLAMESRNLEVYRTAERPSVDCLIKVLINPDDCRPKLNILNGQL